MGHACSVIAPALTPRRSGDRVKTDRRDAHKLARLYRAGELNVIRVPSREEEAARDLVRAREDGLKDRLQARHRLAQFLLRQGRVYRETKTRGVAHREWLRTQRFDWEPLQQTFRGYVRAFEEAEDRLRLLDRQIADLAEKEPYRIPVQYLRCLKGIDTLGAITLVVEAQEFRRFEKACGFMGYTGLVVSERSSGERVRRGNITRVGTLICAGSWWRRHGATGTTASATWR